MQDENASMVSFVGAVAVCRVSKCMAATDFKVLTHGVVLLVVQMGFELVVPAPEPGLRSFFDGSPRFSIELCQVGAHPAKCPLFCALAKHLELEFPTKILQDEVCCRRILVAQNWLVGRFAIALAFACMAAGVWPPGPTFPAMGP